MGIPLEEVFSKLKDGGFRLTRTRQDLIKFILARTGHWTIQSLAAEVKESLPNIGVATIYRTVSLLQGHKLLTETRLGGAAARYEVAPKHHHDHLTCVNCGKIFEFKNEQIEKLQKTIAKRLGFDLLDHRMEMFGRCLRIDCPDKTKK